MSPQTAELLAGQVAPRIRSLLHSSAAQVGSEDISELVQDGLGLAARLLISAQVRGKQLSASTVSYYVAKQLKQGRRSTGQNSTDVLAAATQIAGRSRLLSLDEPLGGPAEVQDVQCLHDVLAGHSADPSQEAARHLDWQPLLSALDVRTREVFLCLVQGAELTTLVPKLKRSRSAIQGDKNKLARLVREHLGEDILQQVQEVPPWMNNLSANRERSACRSEKQTQHPYSACLPEETHV